MVKIELINNLVKVLAKQPGTGFTLEPIVLIAESQVNDSILKPHAYTFSMNYGIARCYPLNVYHFKHHRDLGMEDLRKKLIKKGYQEIHEPKRQ